MKPFWHPLSTLLVAEPLCLATPELLRMMLRAGPVSLIYAGDRMWPALEHGARVDVEPLRASTLEPGMPVLTTGSGIPDLLRIRRVEGERLTLVGDADPGRPIPAVHQDLLGRVDLKAAQLSQARRRRNRLRIDLAEARRGPDSSPDPARTVLEKYDYQAPFYTRAEGPEIDPPLLQAVSRRIPRGSRLVVVGSGSGRECFALAREGYRVCGLDFSPAMIEQSRNGARERCLDVQFHVGDLRTHEEAPLSVHGVFFTYDVYSFLPDADRIPSLERVRSWLDPEGVVFLSARRVRTPYERMVLGLTRWARRRHGVSFGDSHTRWIAGDGELRRSFVHLFTDYRLHQEIHSAGFRQGAWVGGHTVLYPRAPLRPAILLDPSPSPQPG